MCARFTVLNETPIPGRGEGLRRLAKAAGAGEMASAMVGCHTALAQQHHLDALALRLRDFPAQGRFQFPNLQLLRDPGTINARTAPPIS